MRIYRNAELERYKAENLEIRPSWNRRDFSFRVRQYFESSTEKILAICGLRGTGKTVGMLQAADGLPVAYVTAQRGETETGEDYARFLENAPERVIIIDEYGWIQNKKELDRRLLTAVQNGKRIAVTGTESIALEYLKYGVLNHRVENIHTTMFPYYEYKRIYNTGDSLEECDRYLIEGGIFRDYAIKNYDSMKAYVEDAIVDNLAGYLNGEMSEEKARTLVYAVLFKAVCPSNLSSVPELRESKTTLPNFLDSMGINNTLTIDGRSLNRAADIFEQSGIITRIPNIDNRSPQKERYYINNPSLTAQLILAAYGLPSLGKSILGHLFEASVMVQLSHNKLSEHEIFFFDNEGRKNTERKELDIILADKSGEHAYLFECKHSRSNTLRSTSTLRTRHLEQTCLRGTDIDGRYVVYNGAPCVKQYEVGDVLFTPMNDILNEYFLFDAHVQKYGANMEMPL